MSVSRAVYCGMVRLYPREFRVRFVPELIETFDSALPEYGATRMLLDLLCSLQRQWVSAALRKKQRPALVLGSIIHGEYPGFELERPDAARMLQGALVCVLVASAVMGLNQVRTSWSLLGGGVTRVELPYAYTSSELLQHAGTGQAKTRGARRHEVAGLRGR